MRTDDWGSEAEFEAEAQRLFHFGPSGGENLESTVGSQKKAGRETVRL